jgi:acetyltransferase-like isoleucine patch superfamily enzyme
MAFDAPWIARNEIERLLLVPLAWLSLRPVQIGRGWRLYGLPIIQKHRQSTLRIGTHANLRSTRRSNPLVPMHPVTLSTRRAGASLIIGDHFGMTGGAIISEETVTIGNRVFVGANCIISDTDFHPLDAQRRFTHPLDAQTAPIIIGDDVFIGMRSLILKGVTIGARSVIGAGSIVTHDVPPDTIVAGNPARVIRSV